MVSATTVLQALDPGRYEPVLIGLDHDGGWQLAEPDKRLLPQSFFGSSDVTRCIPALPGTLELLAADDGRPALRGPLDVVIPVIHGRGGEDGDLQGLLELAGVPYVGAGVLATALCMDKALSKRVLRDAGLPVVPYLEGSTHQLLQASRAFVDAAEEEFGYPMFVKPTRTGSSVGVRKVRGRAELAQGIKEAARFDLEVLVEPAVDAREIECAVLGGHPPQASVLGEILSPNDFYDYEAKYASDETQLVIPADLPEAVAERVRSLSLEAFEVLKCWGMARVDFFVERRTSRVLVNELNTLPGFTDGSMYPRLWDASGLALPDLIDRLIELALERCRERHALETRYTS